MSAFLEILRSMVQIILMLLEVAMLVRAVLSWLPIRENKFTDFLYAVTEPVVYPIRLLFEKMNWFQNSPIDISFLVAYLLIGFLQIIL